MAVTIFGERTASLFRNFRESLVRKSHQFLQALIPGVFQYGRLSEASSQKVRSLAFKTNE
jgi:hypothetical protein